MSTEPGSSAAAAGPPVELVAAPIELVPRRWNWGAFVFTWLWGLFNGAYWPLLGLLLGFVPSVDLWRHDLPGAHRIWVTGFAISTNTFLFAAWSVFCGLMGDRWAARGRRWRDTAHFRSVQHRWAVAALVFALVLAVVLAAALAGRIFPQGV